MALVRIEHEDFVLQVSCGAYDSLYAEAKRSITEDALWASGVCGDGWHRQFHLGEYGLKKVAIEDVGFAVRMNVYRDNIQGDEAVKSETASQKQRREVVSEGVNEVVNEGVNEGVNNVYEEIRRNPGIRTPSLVKAVGGSQASIERAIAKLKRLQKIVYRGAPKTGGYYCI